MKYLLIYLLVFSALFSCKKDNSTSVQKQLPTQVKQTIKQELKTYLNEHQNFNQDISFLVDFSYKSNRKRFMVYDVQKDSILTKGLVAHGSCGNLPNEKYSNSPNSLCSSLGKYKVDYSYNGKFGLAYKLLGLDETNNNAFERYIVLHAHDCVPDEETNYQICESWGCPTVSPNFLQTLKQYIDYSKKPILLWEYDLTHQANEDD